MALPDHLVCFEDTETKRLFTVDRKSASAAQFAASATHRKVGGKAPLKPKAAKPGKAHKPGEVKTQEAKPNIATKPEPANKPAAEKRAAAQAAAKAAAEEDMEGL